MERPFGQRLASLSTQKRTEGSSRGYITLNQRTPTTGDDGLGAVPGRGTMRDTHSSSVDLRTERWAGGLQLRNLGVWV